MLSLARIVRILTDTRTHEAWGRILLQIPKAFTTSARPTKAATWAFTLGITRRHREVAKLGVEVAYPAQKVFIASIPMSEAA